MTGNILKVISPGPISTIQDLGRSGYQRFGVSVSGAADRYALRLGNLLVGNDQRGAAIEVTLGGAEFEFSTRTTFAITGADLSPSLNGAPIPMWQTVEADTGDRLSLSAPASADAGLRTYVNVSGSIDTPSVLGSRSTHIGARLGGIDGGALKVDDEIPLGPVTNPVQAGRRVPGHLLPHYSGEITARVVPGPQDDYFDANAIETFYTSSYTVTDKSDRMGCRLDGPEVRAVDDAHDIISDGVVTGAIQIPGDAKPIVLLADRQTTGGYAKIGVIASVDLALVAQAAPGARIHFESITADEAAHLARQRMASLRDMTFEEAPPVIENQYLYEVRIDGYDYQVDLTSGARQGQSTAVVNGIEYAIEVDPGE
ncbi:MAG: biotin-dependent carboxyltransferase [Chloroflexi bacterium]|jgi:antagonist of KipI|nr:biotin-dependent carboxyltransferase [Chloroflexota bacterium]